MNTTPGGTYVPAAPFEWLRAGPAPGGYIDRPIVRLGEHHLLRESFFRANPELTRMLADPGRIGHTIDGHPMTSLQGCFARYFSRAADLCESKGAWPAGSTRGTAFTEYLRALVAQIPAVYSVAAGNMKVDVISAPAPIAPTECHCIALCRPSGPSSTRQLDPAEGPFAVPNAPAGSRFLTLEKSFMAGTACVCEWTPLGTHENRGDVHWSTLAPFVSEVCRLIDMQSLPPPG